MRILLIVFSFISVLIPGARGVLLADVHQPEVVEVDIGQTADTGGRAIVFEVEEGGQSHRQLALVQQGKIMVKQAGGNPDQDIIFDGPGQVLYIIDHQNKSYYRIDQGVIDKVVSMIDSLNAVVESQQGVLADLMETLGLSEEGSDDPVVVKKTSTILSAAGIDCRLFQRFRSDKLESELCIAPKDNLTALGEHYETLDSLYIFGDQLLSHAGSILSNMGFTIPSMSKLNVRGLPIMVHSVNDKIVTRLLEIREQNSSEDYFLVPAGYVQTPIPFIG
jgi:hypothetical protein